MDQQHLDSTAGAPPPLVNGNFGAQLKLLREHQGLSRGALARLAKVGPTTLRGIEQGLRDPSPATLAKLRRLPELAALVGPSLSLSVPSLNCWLPPGFQPVHMMQEVELTLGAAGGRLEQSFAYLDLKSAATYLKLTNSKEYEKARRGLPAERAAIAIRHVTGTAGLDVLALGCGDGKLETRMVQELLAGEVQDLRLFLLDISQPLLTEANQYATTALGGRVPVVNIQGNFHHLPRYMHQLGDSPERRRIALMIGGTMGNLDNEQQFFRDSFVGFRTGDLLLLDLSQIYAPADHPDEVKLRDPRLNGKMPRSWVEADEEWLAGPIRRYGGAVGSVKWHYEMDRTTCTIPGSYAVEFRATVSYHDGSQKEFATFRVKRHDIGQLAQTMRQLGWKPIDGWSYGEPEGVHLPRVLYMFQRA